MVVAAPVKNQRTPAYGAGKNRCSIVVTNVSIEVFSLTVKPGNP